MELTGEQMGGAMPQVVANARLNSAPLHAEIQRVLAAANDIGAEMAPDDEPIGMGSVYRGAVGALAGMGEYMVAVTGTLQEMP